MIQNETKTIEIPPEHLRLNKFATGLNTDTVAINISNLQYVCCFDNADVKSVKATLTIQYTVDNRYMSNYFANPTPEGCLAISRKEQI